MYLYYQKNRTFHNHKLVFIIWCILTACHDQVGHYCGPHAPILFHFFKCVQFGSGLWMVSCPSGPSGCGSVDPIVFCINTRGLVHKGHLVSSLDSTASMKSSHHSPFAHICSVVRQGRGLSLGDWETGVQFTPQAPGATDWTGPATVQRWPFRLSSLWLSF